MCQSQCADAHSGRSLSSGKSGITQSKSVTLEEPGSRPEQASTTSTLPRSPVIPGGNRPDHIVFAHIFMPAGDSPLRALHGAEYGHCPQVCCPRCRLLYHEAWSAAEAVTRSCWLTCRWLDHPSVDDLRRFWRETDLLMGAGRWKLGREPWGSCMYFVAARDFQEAALLRRVFLVTLKLSIRAGPFSLRIEKSLRGAAWRLLFPAGCATSMDIPYSAVRWSCCSLVVLHRRSSHNDSTGTLVRSG